MTKTFAAQFRVTPRSRVRLDRFDTADKCSGVPSCVWITTVHFAPVSRSSRSSAADVDAVADDGAPSLAASVTAQPESSKRTASLAEERVHRFGNVDRVRMWVGVARSVPSSR